MDTTLLTIGVVLLIGIPVLALLAAESRRQVQPDEDGWISLRLTFSLVFLGLLGNPNCNTFSPLQHFPHFPGLAA